MKPTSELLHDCLRALNSRDAFMFDNTQNELTSSHNLAHEITRHFNAKRDKDTLANLWAENDANL